MKGEFIKEVAILSDGGRGGWFSHQIIYQPISLIKKSEQKESFSKPVLR